MRRNPKILLAAALIVGAVLWWFSPFSNKQQSLEFGNVGDLARASQEKVGGIENYKYKTTIEAGNQIKVSLTNKVDRKEPKRQMIDFSWNAPGTSGMAAMYANGDSIYLYNPLKDKWELPSEEPTAKPFLDFFWRQVSLVDPVENLIKTDLRGKNVTELKNESEQIPDTSVIQVIPDEAAMSELTKALPPQFAGAELKDLKQVFWISKKDLLVSRYEVRAKVAFFGLKTMNFKTVSIPSDYGSTEIKVPERLNDKIKLQNEGGQ